jgi:hypothetical protein
MRPLKHVLFVLLLAASASAATLTGTVQNKTTGKPSVGDEVALIDLSQGMSVVAQTKSDATGNFSFDFQDNGAPRLVRVTHQGVTYFPQGGPIRPGMTSVEVPVYDAAKKVEGVATNISVMRIQADGGTLQVLEMIAVRNDSKPPRTLAGDRTYEFYLPPGAQYDGAQVQGTGGMSINANAVVDGNSGKRHFNYPIKPGETRFEIAYHMPYSGEAAFTPKIVDNIQHFVVMLPKSISFMAKNADSFSQMENDPTAMIQVATQVKAGADLSFRVSGTGTLPEQQGGEQQAQAGGGAMGGGDSRPGGGLGPPTDAPDPLHQQRWFVLGGLAVVLIAGGVFVVNRVNRAAPAPMPAQTTTRPAAPRVQAKATAAARTPTAEPVAPRLETLPPAVTQDRTGMLLDVLKEELFQLEIEKQQGKISPELYETSRAALNQTLSRALSRRNNS